MGKSTLVLATLAALGLGALVGASLVDDEKPAQVRAVPVAIASTGGAPVYRYLSPDDVTVELDEFGTPIPSTDGENFIGRDEGWSSDTVVIKLPADGIIEYKALMQQGDSIVYSWKTDGGNAYFDFHAHDEAFGEEFFTRYAEGEGDSHSGSIVAPYAGQHGWFLMNLEGNPITITLEVAGFYDEIIRLDVDAY